MFCQFFPPVMNGRIGNASLASDLCSRLPARLSKSHCFSFKLCCIRLLGFLHDLSPHLRIVYPTISLLYKSGESSPLQATSPLSTQEHSYHPNLNSHTDFHRTLTTPPSFPRPSPVPSCYHQQPRYSHQSKPAALAVSAPLPA